jgi:hypothetical protein
MGHYCRGMVDFAKANKVGTPYGLDGGRRIDFQFFELAKGIPGAIERMYANFCLNQTGSSDKARAAFRNYLDESEREK